MTTKALRRALCLVVMLCVAMSAGAVLKEKNLKSTLSVLRAELETSFGEQRQNMARYAAYNQQQQLLNKGYIDIVRGNYSECNALLTGSAAGHGVDNLEGETEEGVALKVAKDAAKKFNCVFALTGAIDNISDASGRIFARRREF